MNKIEILKLKGIDESLFEFYHVTEEYIVISPEFDYEGNIIRCGEEVYKEWLENKDKPVVQEPTEIELLKQENKLLKEQVNFHEELIAEMAMVLYA